jgi:hypothetical protein
MSTAGNRMSSHIPKCEYRHQSAQLSQFRNVSDPIGCTLATAAT